MTAQLLTFPADEANGVRLTELPALTFVEPLPIGVSTPFPDLAALAVHVARLLDGRPFALLAGFGCFAHTTTFPKVTVMAVRPGQAPQDGDWIGAACLRSGGPTPQLRAAADVDALHEALTEAQLFRPVSRA